MYKYLFKTLPLILVDTLLDHVTILFNFSRDCPTVFNSGYIFLHFHWQCTRVQVSPDPRQHMLLPVFLIVVVLMHVRSDSLDLSGASYGCFIEETALFSFPLPPSGLISTPFLNLHSTLSLPVCTSSFGGNYLICVCLVSPLASRSWTTVGSSS